MRLRATKTEMSDAGEDTDGMAESVSKLRNQVLALSGVDIQLSEDTYKDTYTILQEMSKVWDNLSDMDRANILELFFGKRQANIGAALLENFDTVEDVLSTSRNAEGSAEANKTASAYSDICCKTHLIAGNALEPHTTICGKLVYDSLKT